ncbi:hypothetical protein BDC45DRAFT_537268 [Circinella umbellata]|nr:hypothetical protein BDC45DRAFT_537268 [Circinella umbellata]
MQHNQLVPLILSSFQPFTDLLVFKQKKKSVLAADSKTQTSVNTSPPMVLCFASITQPERVPLAHTHRQTNTNEMNKIVYYFQVWRTGRSLASVIFNTSLCPGIVDDTIDILMKKFPSNNDILPHCEGSHVLAEINLSLEEQ